MHLNFLEWLLIYEYILCSRGVAEKVEMAQAAEEAARKAETRNMVERKNDGGRNAKRMLSKPTKSENLHKRQRKN